MGANTTVTEQVPLTGSDAVQLLLPAGTANAALFEAIELMASGALPQFVTWTLCDAVVCGKR